VAPDKRMLSSAQIIPVLHQCLALMVFFAVAGLFVVNVLLISNRDTDRVYHFIKYFSRNVPHHYVRPTENSCKLHKISLKYIPECGLDSQLSPRYTKPLLIVAVQRSGDKISILPDKSKSKEFHPNRHALHVGNASNPWHRRPSRRGWAGRVSELAIRSKVRICSHQSTCTAYTLTLPLRL
jgi:hypothetical protein